MRPYLRDHTFSHFGTVLVCDVRTGRHRTTAYVRRYASNTNALGLVA